MNIMHSNPNQIPYLKMNSTESWQDKLRAMLEASGGVPQEEDTEITTAEATVEGKTVQKSPLAILYERKGRGGKQATIISGFELSEPEIQEIAARIKKKLATGGSARGGEILIQGDRREDLRKLLPQLGFKLR